MSPESPSPESLDKPLRVPLQAQPSAGVASPPAPPPTAPSIAPAPVGGVVDSKSNNSSDSNSDSKSMPSRRSSCVIGIDVGGTNTDWQVFAHLRCFDFYFIALHPQIQHGINFISSLSFIHLFIQVIIKIILPK